MTLLPKLFTIDQVHDAIGTEHLARRTLDDIVRELGYRKGRGKQRLFTQAQICVIQEGIQCQRITSQEAVRAISTGLSEVQLMASSKKSCLLLGIFVVVVFGFDW